MFNLIYHNVDALDVSFQGAFPEHILLKLEAAKKQALEEDREVAINIGLNHTQILVSKTAARGGYAYRFDTGPEGEIWFIKRNTDPKNWNIRVSVASLQLAISGYEAVKERLTERLLAFECLSISAKQSAYLGNESAYGDEISGKNKRLIVPKESISRVDYCFDFITDKGFQVAQNDFVAHPRIKKMAFYDPDSSTVSQGALILTHMLGKQPGRQVVLYNKIREIQDHNKPFYWDIWDLDHEEIKLDNKEIWRVEIRAGKKELEQWNVKTFEDLDRVMGDIILSILNDIRLAVPDGDRNRSRWPTHPLWQQCIDLVPDILGAYASNASRGKILIDMRDNKIKEYLDRILGNLIGLTAAQGSSFDEISATLDIVKEYTDHELKKNAAKAEQKYVKAADRFQFLI